MDVRQREIESESELAALSIDSDLKAPLTSPLYDTINRNILDDECKTQAADSEIKNNDGIELPSAVTDRLEISMPENVSKDDPRIYGKWLFFTNGDLKFQDDVWLKLHELIKSGDLILLCSSTAKKCDERGPFQGVVKCYTCKDFGAIKRSGLMIQNILKDNTILNYKTNQASRGNLYRSFGDRFITKYMLTVNGNFYMKDKLDRWIKITHTDTEDDIFQESCAETCVAPTYPISKSRKQISGQQRNYRPAGQTRYQEPKTRGALGEPDTKKENTFGLLPSKETKIKRYVYPGYASLNNFSGIWCLFCNAADADDDAGLTELDTVWRGVKDLCDEGYFKGIACETNAFKPGPGDNLLRRSVTCEVDDYLYVKRAVQSADKLRERISYKLPMYLKVCYYDEFGKIRYLLKYLYTEDEELYDYVNDKWTLLEKT